MLLARMVALVEQSLDKGSTLAAFGQFCRRAVNETQEISHNLLGEKYVGQIDTLREMALCALNTESVSQVRLVHFIGEIWALILIPLIFSGENGDRHDFPFTAAS